MSTEVRDRRFAAMGLALAAIGMIVVFGSHPSSMNGDFRELMQAEVREQVRSLAVHGGFIFIEALSLTSFLMLARAYADASARVTAASVALALGVAALALSMTVDGIVVPSLAARYLEATPGIEAAGIRGSLVLCSALIEALMPVGFVFSSVVHGELVFRISKHSRLADIRRHWEPTRERCDDRDNYNFSIAPPRSCHPWVARYDHFMAHSGGGCCTEAPRKAVQGQS